MDKSTILSTRLRIRQDANIAFSEWQAKLNLEITHFPGFISLEIISPAKSEWLITQHFMTAEDITKWRLSKEHDGLTEEVKTLCTEYSETELPVPTQEGISQFFIIEVDPKNEDAFKLWISKIHRAEANFKGFKGMYVQSPTDGKSKNWLTYLQFDSVDNLDRWLNSYERQELLAEAKGLITSFESHRMITSYAGWFSSIAKKGELPPVWKQSMLVLLVLYPLIMLELRYLSPKTENLHFAVATFVGNALSVTLISWPMMPLAILALGWWLVPKSRMITIVGMVVVLALYLLEILFFMNFF